MDGQMDGWIGGWMDGWMHGWVDGSMNVWGIIGTNKHVSKDRETFFSTSDAGGSSVEKPPVKVLRRIAETVPECVLEAVRHRGVTSKAEWARPHYGNWCVCRIQQHLPNNNRDRGGNFPFCIRLQPGTEQTVIRRSFFQMFSSVSLVPSSSALLPSSRVGVVSLSPSG